MKKDYIFTACMLVFFIIFNILINFTVGGLNILFTVLFFVSWGLFLIGLYFIIHEHVKNNKIGDIEKISNHQFELSYNFLYNNNTTKEIIDILGDDINLPKNKLERKIYDKLLEDNNLKYKESIFFSYQNEFTTGVYLSYPICFLLFSLGIVFFISYFYFDRYGLVQYENFAIINGVILVSQILIRILIDLKIIRFKIN